MYSQAELVFIPENLPGPEGGIIARLLIGHSRCLTMSEFGAKENRPGVPKTRQITADMTTILRGVLDTNAISFASDFSTFPAPDTTIAQMKQTLLSQMLNFRRDNVTGKLTGKGGTVDGERGRDDFVVALMMTLYWSRVFRQNSRYDADRARIHETPLRAVGV
jgi:hypothetical protein